MKRIKWIYLWSVPHLETYHTSRDMGDLSIISHYFARKKGGDLLVKRYDEPTHFNILLDQYKKCIFYKNHIDRESRCNRKFNKGITTLPWGPISIVDLDERSTNTPPMIGKTTAEERLSISEEKSVSIIDAIADKTTSNIFIQMDNKLNKYTDKYIKIKMIVNPKNVPNRTTRRRLKILMKYFKS